MYCLISTWVYLLPATIQHMCPKEACRRCAPVAHANPIIQRQGNSSKENEKGAQIIRTDDKKLQTSLKKLNVQPIQAIEEVNMFKEDGNVIHFAAPKGNYFLSPELVQLLHPLFGKIYHLSKTTNHPPSKPQSTPPSPPTPSPSTATARTKN